MDTARAQAHALWRLSYLAGQELIEAAIEALIAGLDTPSLRVLAYLPLDRLDHAAALSDRALQELGRRPMVRLPPRQEAALWAEAIAAGAVSVPRGVAGLEAVAVHTDDWPLRAALVALVADWHRWERASPEHRRRIERQVMDRAGTFLRHWPASVPTDHRVT